MQLPDDRALFSRRAFLIGAFGTTTALLAGTFLVDGCSHSAPKSLQQPGAWDGTTQTAALARPYEDPAMAHVTFGIISYYHHPWRSYMDTWSTAKYLETPAAVWNTPDKYSEPVAQVLQEMGIVSVRIEEPWGKLDWNDQIPAADQARLKTLLTLLKNHGIRPHFLLNGNHGDPCPMKTTTVQLVAPAAKGDTSLQLNETSAIRVGYTGIHSPKSAIAAFPMITSVAANGVVQLSLPMRVDLPAGPLTLQELKYQPLQPAKLADGTPVPASDETYEGWIKYVKAIATFVRDTLGTGSETDCGFDLEVWNEITFGSDFLDSNLYYKPPRTYAGPADYSKTRPLLPTYRPDAQLSFDAHGATILLARTVDFINDPANGFPGVHVISGLSNERPWDSGTSLWDKQSGFSRHYYTGGWVDCSPATPFGAINHTTIDALDHLDGTPDHKDWLTIVPGTNFIPTFRCGLPELLHFGFRSESLSRDILPDSRHGGFKGHGRYTHNGDYRIAQVWETETNYFRKAFFDDLIKTNGYVRTDPQLQALDKHMAGKMALRQYVFHSHKGLRRIYIYCIQADPYAFGMFSPAFYAALDTSGGTVTDTVRAELPPAYLGMHWLQGVMKQGVPLEAPRPLRVDALVEHQPRLVFAGDGTDAHPDLFNRDVFAFLPFQVDASSYVIPYYVVALDVTHAWDAAKDPRDPARYDMPAQDFDVTIGNVRGAGAHVMAFDLQNNAEVPVTILAATDTTLTVRLSATDCPRVLRITETADGPQIIAPVTRVLASGEVSVAWSTNIPAECTVTYGADWENRGAASIHAGSAKTNFSVTIPAGIKGVEAIRISAQADSLTNVWPRWDEDPRGQVVIPGGTATQTPA